MTFPVRLLCPFTLTPNVVTLENLLVTEDGLYTLLFYMSFKQELHP